MRLFPGRLSESDLVSLGVVEVCYKRSSSTLMFQDLEDEALSSELVSIQLPDSKARFTCSDKASLVGGSASGFPFFENKIALASSTDPMVSNLYILQTNSLISFIFSSVSSPSPREERSVWCFRNTFQADFLNDCIGTTLCRNLLMHGKAEEWIQNQLGDFCR